MIQQFIHRLLIRRHFWRHATFSEVAELYASRVLRMTALHMASGFISIYLYQIGYPIAHIALFWVAFYLFKVMIAIPCASLVARIGPKHSILVSNILYIPALISFALLPIVGAWAFIPILFFEGMSAVIYSIGHNVDFSKVKNFEHAGKEIAFMNIVEKVAAGLSPVIGGAIALFFGPQVVLIVSASLFLIAATPLFLTGEPIQPGKRLNLKAIPWRLIRRHGFAQGVVGFDYFIAGSAWSLFITAVVVGAHVGDEIYIITGMISSVVIFVSLIASYAYGRFIDNKHGRSLLLISGVMVSATHLARGSVGSPVMAAGLNVVNEAASTGYLMSYTRAVFDNTDLSGNRTTYLGVTEIITNTGAACAAATLAFLAFAFTSEEALRYIFFIAAGVSLLLLTARFPLYRR